MSTNRFKTKKIEQKNEIATDKKAKNLAEIEQIGELYDEEDKLVDFEKPITRSRLITISVVLSIIFGFVAGTVGVIFFFSDSFSMLKLGTVEDLLPIQQLKIERHEQVNVLEEERIGQLLERVNDSLVVVFEKKEIGGEVLDNIYFSSEKLGNGFVLTADGWLMSNAKTIFDAERDYVVVTNDKQILNVEKIIFDDFSDTVFLQVEAKNLSTLPLIELKDVNAGERFLVFNNLVDIKQNVAFLRLVEKDWYDDGSRDKIQKGDLRANGSMIFDEQLANSYLGSPIISLQGEVAGLLVGSGGLVVGRSTDDFKQAMTQILSGQEKVLRINLGMRYVDLSRAIGANLKVSQGDQMVLLDKGVLVTQMTKGGLAEKAGIKVGDVVVKVGEDLIGVPNDFSRLVQKYGVDESFNITLLRQGEAEEMVLLINL